MSARSRSRGWVLGHVPEGHPPQSGTGEVHRFATLTTRVAGGSVMGMTEDRSRLTRMLEPWRGAPDQDVDPVEVDRHHRRRSAAGVEAVAVAANRAAGQMGPLRAMNTLRQ